MLLKTRGIIFRSVKYGESSLILEVYTEERGIRKYIVSGVRKPCSRTPASTLQLMNLVDLIAYERPGKDMTRIKEVRPARVFARIPFEVERGTIGLFMLEAARNSIREAEENAALFRFLYDSFAFLDGTEGPVRHIHLHFLLGLTAHLGFLPAGAFGPDTTLFDLREGRFTGGFPGHTDYLDARRSKLMYRLLHAEWDELAAVRSTREERSGLLTDLLRYYHYHIEGMREINSLPILRQVMGGSR